MQEEETIAGPLNSRRSFRGTPASAEVFLLLHPTFLGSRH